VSAILQVVDHYAMTHPEDVARRLERLDVDDAGLVVAALPPGSAAALLPHVAQSHAARILTALPAEAAAAVTGAMPIDLAASLLRRVEPPVVTRILTALPNERSRSLGALLAHEPLAAGGVMDPEVFTLPLAISVAAARDLMASNAEHLYYYVYVVNADHRLVGVLDIAELLQADGHAPLRTVVPLHVTWLSADAPLASVFAHPGWRTFDALPVVDHDGRFLGVLRHRRMRQLQEEDMPASGDDRAVRTVMALGEVYWLGLCGLLQGIASTASESDAPESAARGDAS
jgi:magnesium transporter